MPASLSSGLLSSDREPEPRHGAASDRGSAYMLVFIYSFKKDNFKTSLTLNGSGCIADLTVQREIQT